VSAWDGREVSFRCLPHLYEWAEGCGYQGKISPFDGTGKIPWKVEWAVKWQAIGVTIETAGKDHMSKGGSHDVSSAICKEVLDYPVPFAFPYEFFLIGGKKMSSSKGLGSSAKEVFGLLPPEILRFLMARPRYSQAIDFDPGGWTIPDLFDEYDRCARAFYNRFAKGKVRFQASSSIDSKAVESFEKKTPPFQDGEAYKKGRKSDFGRIFELSQVKSLPQEEPFYPRFREVANYLQMPNTNLVRHFEEVKGKTLTKFEKELIKERVHYAEIWLKDHAPSEAVFFISEELPKEAKELTQEQKAYLQKLADLLEKKWPSSADELQTVLYNLVKEQGIKSSKAFEAIYLVLIGKSHGPKAAWLIFSQGKKFVIKRFKEAS
jgi:lysyl-tRNA synthetase class 1